MLAANIQFAWRYDDIPEYMGRRLVYCHAIMRWEQQQSFLCSSSSKNDIAATDPLIEGFEIEMLLFIQCTIEVGCQSGSNCQTWYPNVSVVRC